jgi:hypothetical protein
MIWISEVFPPSTKEELPPKEMDFKSNVTQKESNFQTLLDEEMKKLRKE